MPESHFKLNYRTDYDSMVHIKCSAFNVYPTPKLTLKYDLFVQHNNFMVGIMMWQRKKAQNFK